MLQALLIFKLFPPHLLWIVTKAAIIATCLSQTTEWDFFQALFHLCCIIYINSYCNDN